MKLAKNLPVPGDICVDVARALTGIYKASCQQVLPPLNKLPLQYSPARLLVLTLAYNNWPGLLLWRPYILYGARA